MGRPAKGGESVWIGKDRSESTLKGWLESVPIEKRKAIDLFAMDMQRGG
jgi:transposase